MRESIHDKVDRVLVWGQTTGFTFFIILFFWALIHHYQNLIASCYVSALGMEVGVFRWVSRNGS